MTNKSRKHPWQDLGLLSFWGICLGIPCLRNALPVSGSLRWNVSAEDQRGSTTCG